MVVFESRPVRYERARPPAKLSSSVPVTARSTASKLEKIVGRTDGWKEAASKIPIVASATVRYRGGTFCGGSRLDSAYTIATTIGPTSHAAGSPIR
jgi:secreted trypsin-like serine protease